MKKFINKNLSVIFVVGTILVAALGSIFVGIGMEWFNLLIKPSQWIANFIIPVVWSIIYLSVIVISYFLIKEKLFSNNAIWLSLVNGILNVLWCLIFFTLKLTFLGNVVIIINAFFAVLLLNELVKTKKWFVNVLWIYPIWLFIATSLNMAIWILN